MLFCVLFSQPVVNFSHPSAQEVFSSALLKQLPSAVLPAPLACHCIQIIFTWWLDALPVLLQNCPCGTAPFGTVILPCVQSGPEAKWCEQKSPVPLDAPAWSLLSITALAGGVTSGAGRSCKSLAGLLLT